MSSLKAESFLQLVKEVGSEAGLTADFEAMGSLMGLKIEGATCKDWRVTSRS